MRKQSTLFCLMALAFALLAPLLPPVDNTAGLLIVAGLILLLGVPHGALDPVFAAQRYGVRGVAGWLLFGACYIAAAALVVVWWQAAPKAFLLAFLLVSTVHFSGDMGREVPWPAKALYGGAIIVLPALLHAADVEALFQTLVGAAKAHAITRRLVWLALPWLVGLVLAALAVCRRAPRAACEMAALGCLAIFAPPLYAFTVFFCVMHAARHILRTVAYADGSPAGRLIAANAVPMLLVVAAVLIVLVNTPHRSIDATLVRTIFVGLAALTAPHMALIERIRHEGWRRPDALPPAPQGVV
jgi:Brp/Blh family beta-carotene 15,15'-monooxygenase